MLYFVTDKTHSLADWNQAPPADPLNYGMTIAVSDDQSRKQFHQFSFDDYQNVIVSIVHPGDDFHESRGFSLKRDASIRVLAVGERANGRRSMADYGVIVNARTRAKVWTMDVERTHHAGGASKNRYVDEVLHLPKGTYIVSYYTDDSHSYDDWNDDPPFDPSHYGITVMGADPDFSPSDVGPYVEEKDKSLIAQIVRVGDDEDKSETFTLDRPTRIRVYAIGEGQGRDMSDYGMIEDTKTGTSIWEMTYAMTFHAGGARKNRMVNITITLERGTYKLRYLTDGSHSYEEWNADPPDDPEYYGISLYREDDRPSVSIPPIPQQPAMRVPPHPPLPH
jgi:hypothetical protein